MEVATANGPERPWLISNDRRKIMLPLSKSHFEVAARISADLVLSVVRGEIGRKKSITIWTSSRILEQAGIAWRLPEQRKFLLRLDHILRDLARQGLITRRARAQTSRNQREEVAYELPHEKPNQPPQTTRAFGPRV